MPRSATARKKPRRNQLGPLAAALAAPIPDIELLIGAMANPDSGIRFVLGILRRAGQRVSEVQSVLFDKLKWTLQAAKAWLRDHGFDVGKLDEGATFWRFRQKAPGRYKEYATIVPGRTNPGNPEKILARVYEHEYARKIRQPFAVVYRTDDPMTRFGVRRYDGSGWFYNSLEEALRQFKGMLIVPVRSRNPDTDRHPEARGRIRQRAGVVLHEGIGRTYRQRVIFAGTEEEAHRVADDLRAQGKDVSVVWLRAGSGLRRGWQQNPAARLYEDFHGTPPEHTKRIVTEREERDWLAELGTLTELKVATLSGLDATIRFNGNAPVLGASEDGRQLFIEGGDQEISLSALKMDGPQWKKDSMVLGVLYELTYQTRKGYDSFVLSDYYHGLGEESGVQPMLLYDPHNKLLSISGGQYKVKREGIVN